jgi:Uma2 family endonuclease
MAESKAIQALVTAEELLAMPDGGGLCELIEGKVVEMAPAGDAHGRVQMRLINRLGVYAADHGLGEVWSEETGFLLRRNPDTVRCADGAFIVTARVPAMSKGFVEVVPDLVLEIVSPTDRPKEVHAKVGEWLEAGVRVVWVLWPERRRFLVYHDFEEMRTLGPDETLTCEELLPGFALPLAPLFADR